MQKTSHVLITIACVMLLNAILLFALYTVLSDFSLVYVSASMAFVAVFSLAIGLLFSIFADHKKSKVSHADMERMKDIVHKYYKLRSEEDGR